MTIGSSTAWLAVLFVGCSASPDPGPAIDTGTAPDDAAPVADAGSPCAQIDALDRR